MNNDGSYSAISKNLNSGFDFIAFGPRTAPEPLLMNLLAASPSMYQQLTLQYRALSGLIELFESCNDNNSKELIKSLRQLQNGCLLAQSVAQNGINEVALMLQSENKYKKDIDNNSRKG